MLLGCCLPFTGHAQGTLRFITGDLENGPFVFNADLRHKYNSFFRGQIYAGPDPDSLVPVGASAQFGLLNGEPDARANGLILDGSILTVPTVAGGEVGYYQLRAWCGAHLLTYEAALGSGATTLSVPVVSVQFGDEGQGVATPNTDGFASFTLLGHIECVPEPSVMAVGLLGLGGLARWGRRRMAIGHRWRERSRRI